MQHWKLKLRTMHKIKVNMHLLLVEELHSQILPDVTLLHLAVHSGAATFSFPPECWNQVWASIVHSTILSHYITEHLVTHSHWVTRAWCRNNSIVSCIISRLILTVCESVRFCSFVFSLLSSSSCFDFCINYEAHICIQCK